MVVAVAAQVVDVLRRASRVVAKVAADAPVVAAVFVEAVSPCRDLPRSGVKNNRWRGQAAWRIRFRST